MEMTFHSLCVYPLLAKGSKEVKGEKPFFMSGNLNERMEMQITDSKCVKIMLWVNFA